MKNRLVDFWSTSFTRPDGTITKERFDELMNTTDRRLTVAEKVAGYHINNEFLLCWDNQIINRHDCLVKEEADLCSPHRRLFDKYNKEVICIY